MEERLQKIIARAGIASRRHAEEMITSGLVTVNGTTVTELGSKADESRDHIKVAGKLLQPRKALVYLLLNKPSEVVATMSDPEGRQSLQDLLHGVSERVFPVGRLEYHSAGLVFLTNDGDLANQLLRSHQVRQTYNLKLKTLLTFEEIETLGRATGAHIERIRGKESPWYSVTLSEASSDVLRDRLFQSGHPVEKIRRVGIANLELGSLEPGSYRELTSTELAAFRRVIASGETLKEGESQSHHTAAAKHAPRHGAQRHGSRNRWRDRKDGEKHAENSGGPRSGRSFQSGDSYRGPGGEGRDPKAGFSHRLGSVEHRGQNKKWRGEKPRGRREEISQDKPRNPFFRPGQHGTGRGPSSGMPTGPARRSGPSNASYVTPRIERPNITSSNEAGAEKYSPRSGPRGPWRGAHGNPSQQGPRNAGGHGKQRRHGSSQGRGGQNSSGDLRHNDGRGQNRNRHRSVPRTDPSEHTERTETP